MSDHLVLIIMIDALGVPMADAAFLPELDRPRTPIRSVIGYSSAAIPTLFTGVLPDQHGHFSMYRRAGRTGVFQTLKPWLALAGRTPRGQWRLRRWADHEVRRRGVTGYYSLYEIPLSLLGHFDLCQRRDIYAPGAFDGRRTLIDEMTATGRARIWSWRAREDRMWGEAAAAIEQGGTEFLLLYLTRLDSVMHTSGPMSAPARACLGEYADQIRGLLGKAQGRYGDVRVFIFGDHGMAPVKASHDLWGQLRRLPDRVPRDYLLFLDSTMARFWFHRTATRERVRSFLAEQTCGRILSEADLRDLGVLFPSAEYGELIFLMNEGEILVPSFMSSQPVRGMHGYHPQAEHSHTVLVTNVSEGESPRDLIGLHRLLMSEVRGTAS